MDEERGLRQVRLVRARRITAGFLRRSQDHRHGEPHRPPLRRRRVRGACFVRAAPAARELKRFKPSRFVRSVFSC